MNIFELFGEVALKGSEKINQQLSQLEKNTQKVQKGLKVAGAAFTAVGAAGLAMIQSTKAINAQLGVTALNLGVTTKEMRDLALATTNVTFPIGEVTASFDLLARAGIKDTEVLKATATAFDTLGDATGKSASEVTSKMVPAMKTFGLSAEEVAGKSDAMTHLIRNSTVSMDNFGSVVGYITPELVNMGLSMDDTIALMGIMESKGMSGEVATRAFRTAITRATKEQIPLNEALGITSEELAEYQTKLDGATGLTDKYADAANEQYTIMDKVKQKFSEITLGMSGFLEPLEPVLAGMTALGPIMLIVATNTKIATLAVRAFGIAWKVAAGPIGWAILAIGLLAGAGVALWKNWDKVTGFFEKAWVSIKVYFLEGVRGVLDSLMKFTSWIPFLGDKIQEAHDALSSMVDAEEVRKDVREVEKLAGEMVDTIRGKLEEERDLKLKAVQESRDIAQQGHDNQIEDLRKTFGVLEGFDEDYQESKMDKARKATDEMRKQYDRDIDAARNAYDEKIRFIDAEYSAKLKLLDDETASIVSEYQRQIDEIDARTEVEEQAKKEVERKKRLLELEGAVSSAETEEDRLKAISQLEDYQAKVDRDRLLESRRAEKNALREQIDEARRAASEERDRLQVELNEKKEHEQALLSETITRLEDEKVALDVALEAELVRIDELRVAFEEATTVKLDAELNRLLEEEAALTLHYENQLSEIELHVAAVNAATAKLKDRTITITTVHRDVYKSGGGGDGGVTPETPGLYDPIYMEHGGVIPEPTLLTSLRTMRPYAVAGEKGREFITPGIPTVNIHIDEMNVRNDRDIDLIAEQLVNRIRLRTGVKV